MLRAVAGEAGVAFISSSASEFIEMYMGLGAARVRDVFNTVRGRANREEMLIGMRPQIRQWQEVVLDVGAARVGGWAEGGWYRWGKGAEDSTSGRGRRW